MLNKAMILAVVQTSFDHCARAYRDVPSAANFIALQSEMRALQVVRNRDETTLIELLKDIGVGAWTDVLAAEQVDEIVAMFNRKELTIRQALNG